MINLKSQIVISSHNNLYLGTYNMADKVQKQIVTTEALYDSLLIQIGDTLESGRKTAAVRVNETIVETYWQIGKYIVEFEQAGNEKAEYVDTSSGSFLF